MQQVTFGQYYKADSLIHRLDPRVKLFGTLIYIISLFLPGSFYGLITAFAGLSLVLFCSKIPVLKVLKGVRPVIIIILFSAAVNLLMTRGTVVWSLGPIHITKEGIILAVYLALRLTFLIMGSSVMTYTTTPNQLTDGLERSFRFLNRLHVPVHEIAMMMSIALRFIPILTEELQKIKKAQMSRGADFESGNLIERGRKLLPLLVPLFVAAIRRANELALAMDARCYRGGEGRTSLHPLRYEKRDYIAYGCIAAYLAGMIWICVALV